MPYPNYETKWVDALPQIGAQCPACQKGFIEKNTFTSKKGEVYQSVKCETCFSKWIISHGFPEGQSGGAKIKDNTGQILLMEEIQGLKRHIDERFDKLAKYLQGELEK